MKLRLKVLEVLTRRGIEKVDLDHHITFLHGAVGAGKSTVARLVDYCFGGEINPTPAMQREWIGTRLHVDVGVHDVLLEREPDNPPSIRASWTSATGPGHALVPIDEPGQARALIEGTEVFNLSDLMFFFLGVEPVKVRRSKRDPESPLVRLSFRDLFWYCYLEQDSLDSSFFRFEDTYRRYKSIDALRFFLGLHSDRINELEKRLATAQDLQRAKRAAVEHVSKFLGEFQADETDVAAQLAVAAGDLAKARALRKQLEDEQMSKTHAAEPLRDKLRELGRRLADEQEAELDLAQRLADQESLRSELITAKVKAARADAASAVLAGADFERCPHCGRSVPSARNRDGDACYLCCQSGAIVDERANLTIAQQEISSQLDELSDSIRRHKVALQQQRRRIARLVEEKARRDQALNDELKKYDSAFVSAVRNADREVASLEERIRFLRKLGEMPAALLSLDRDAATLQGEIEVSRVALQQERDRLARAGNHVEAIEAAFLDALLAIGFPGVSAGDRVLIDRRSWEPHVINDIDGEISWGFLNAGSGGKKVLFNICYALAVHRVVAERHLRLPRLLIIDSPTKNISRDVNPELVAAFYAYLYSLAQGSLASTQFLIIDSNLVSPALPGLDFAERLMRPGDPEHPPLISYYVGP